MWITWGAFAVGAEHRVPTTFPTIDAALDVALAGDTVRLVADHTESVDVDVDVILTGDPGVTLTADGDFALDVPSGVSVTLSGLRLTGGGVDPCLEVSGVVVIDDVTFTGCAGGNGGALHLPDPGSATVLRSRFVGNTASRGAHIYAFGPSLIIEDTEFAYGVGSSEGAIHSTLANALVLRRSTFVGNTSLDDGGALSLTGASAEIEDCLFDGNVATNSGGAIFASDLPLLRVSNSRFVGNTAGRAGAMDLSDVDDALIEASELRCNEGGSSGGGGGAVRVFDPDGGDGLVFRGVLFAGNRSTGAGGGAYLTGASGVFDFTTFVGNVSSDGDALYATSSGSVELTNSVIALHLATAVHTEGGWSGDTNVWFGNASHLVGGVLGANSVVGVDPEFQGDANDCREPALWSQVGSPVLGTADPASPDPDPGAYGGPTPVCAPLDVFADADVDGFGDPASPARQCGPLGPEWSLVGGDCNDAASDVFPGSPERCNGDDDDCDGAVDEGACDTGAPASGHTGDDTGSFADTGGGETGGSETGAPEETGAEETAGAGSTGETGPGETGRAEPTGVPEDTGQVTMDLPVDPGCRCGAAGGPRPIVGWLVLGLTLARRRPIRPSPG